MFRTVIKENEYHDSVFLMNISANVQNTEGVKQVVIVMGTEMNKTVLADVGMLSSQAEEATPHDMIIAVEAQNEQGIEEVLVKIDHLMTKGMKREEKDITYPTFELALGALPEANLALISVPGEFAAKEAKKAIMKGLHVFIFSDNVPLSEEVELKKLAQEKGILVMGPGCGTAVINNVSLGLMSAVEPGPIGIVGASGSGIQEIAVLINKEGLGISQAIGTGGRDLSEEVGGMTMIQGIKALENDEKTAVIVLVSKPPSPKTMQKVLNVVFECKKPVVINFLGVDHQLIETRGAVSAHTLEEAALKAVRIIKKEKPLEDFFKSQRERLTSFANAEKSKFASQQKYVRGLFCGGTHCEESILILDNLISDLYSNVPLHNCRQLEDVNTSYRNSLIDMGDEEFTKGRPHPVIDLTMFKERLVKESRDAEVAVILLDVILGYGAHFDPAGVMADTIASIKEKAAREGRNLCFVASVCGTDKDPQNLGSQERKLKKAGVIVTPSNAQASLLSGLLVS